MPWDPEQYLAFRGPRLRPAMDLLTRLESFAADGFRPGRVVDLGCGTGHITRLLASRWPEARVVGVDHSPDMLAEARAGEPTSVRFESRDIARWEPGEPFDLIFSNAALHWLDDHERLFPRLLRALSPGGILAVQVPHNHAAPSHTCATAAVREGPWAEALVPVLRPAPVADPQDYYGMVAPLAAEVDCWETEYLHVLEGTDPVAEWTKGSLLRPLLAELDDEQAAAFERDYRRRLREAYPRRADGTTLFPFRRLFLLVRTPA